MDKIMKKLLLLIFILISSNVQSQDSVMMVGTGTMSCGKFIDFKNKGNKTQLDLFVQWTWGFLSSYNIRGNFGTDYTVVSPIINNLPDSETVILFITKDCEKHPLDTVLMSVMRLGKSLGGKIVVK